MARKGDGPLRCVVAEEVHSCSGNYPFPTRVAWNENNGPAIAGSNVAIFAAKNIFTKFSPKFHLTHKPIRLTSCSTLPDQHLFSNMQIYIRESSWKDHFDLR